MRRSALSDLLLSLMIHQGIILMIWINAQFSTAEFSSRSSVRLRRLGLVAMALATLGGCVAADYWPYTGSYYLGGYANPGYIYRYPGILGRVWRLLGWRRAWPLA